MQVFDRTHSNVQKILFAQIFARKSGSLWLHVCCSNNWTPTWLLFSVLVSAVRLRDPIHCQRILQNQLSFNIDFQRIWKGFLFDIILWNVYKEKLRYMACMLLALNTTYFGTTFYVIQFRFSKKATKMKENFSVD